jgi:hypothetical protein
VVFFSLRPYRLNLCLFPLVPNWLSW